MSNSFEKVEQRNGQPVRGLWKRGDRYYVQTTVPDPHTGLTKVTRLSLPKTVKTVPEAISAMHDLIKKVSEGDIISPGKGGPSFKEFREHYDKLNVKAAKTKYNENHFLEQWEKFLHPDTKVTAITTKTILAYRAEKQNLGLSPRTINLHVRALKQLLLLAKQEGYFKHLPLEGVKQMREPRKERPLMKAEELISLGMNALEFHDRSGEQFANYLSVLMYSGGRRDETLALKWSDVDWDNKQLVFFGKGSKTRRVDFNKNLENVLRSMANRDLKYKQEETKPEGFLFPSCRSEGAVTTLKKILTFVRADSELFHFTWHLTRHYFASQCVMSGVDFMTIAKWLGHTDGGVLIGKIYGHLRADYQREQARKLTF